MIAPRTRPHSRTGSATLPALPALAALSLAGLAVALLLPQDPAPAPAPAPQDKPAETPAPADAPADAPAQKPAEKPAEKPATPATPAAPAEQPKSDDLESTYFRTADYNNNGWLSIPEASQSLGADTSEFAIYDQDHDGRIDREEFGARYRDTISRGGSFNAPVPRKTSIRPPARNAAQLRSAYDEDGDGSLGSTELGRVIEDYQLRVAGADAFLKQLDRDHSGRLDQAELESLAHAIATAGNPALAPPDPEAATTVQDLFGRPEPRPRLTGGQAEPPRIAGPVPPFLRLDLDRNGFIEERELRELEGFAQVGLRATTVLAGLDKDGDLRVSRAEFQRAISRAR